MKLIIKDTADNQEKKKQSLEFKSDQKLVYRGSFVNIICKSFEH